MSAGLNLSYVWIAFVFMAWAMPSRAVDLSEYQVKAAFIYNFAKFVEWPADAAAARGGNFSVCIIGQDPFGAAFASVEGRLVSGRPLRVRRDVRLDDALGCQIAFIAESEERRYQALLKILETAPILTISDIEGFAEAGGAVGLFVLDKRLKFDANFATLQRTNLKASSQVLRLARTVYGIKR